jgi:hypothetical protein
LFTPTAAVFVEVGKSRTLRDSKLAADATAYSTIKRTGQNSENCTTGNSAKNSTPQKFGTLKCVLIWADLKGHELDIG